MSMSTGFLITLLLTALNLKAESESNNKPEPTKFQLTVIVVGYRGSTETITSSPEGIHCGSTCTASFDARTPITLSAYLDGSYKFKGWGGEGPISQSLTIWMDTNKTVTAYYEIWDDDHDNWPHNIDCNDGDANVFRSDSFYLDDDGDGYSNGKKGLVCYGPFLWLNYQRQQLGPDCAEGAREAWRTGQFYIDADEDGYSAGQEERCYGASIPKGYSQISKGIDCDDSDASVTLVDHVYIDFDRDGYDAGSIPFECTGGKAPPGYSYHSLGNDCNDNDASVTLIKLIYIDFDRDGYDAGQSLIDCIDGKIPPGYSQKSLGNDCDDNNISIYQPVYWYLDRDRDGHATDVELSCKSPGIGYTTKYISRGDCNDMDSSIYAYNRYFLDTDHDGYGSTNSINICSNIVPNGYSVITGDCDDINAAIHSSRKYFEDADGDGFGNERKSILSCSVKGPVGYVSDSSDCNDLKLMYADLDGDGFGADILAACFGVSNKSDCDDNNPTIHQDCLKESLDISRDSVLPPRDPIIVINHGPININIQTMQEVDIKVRDTDIYRRELKSEPYYDSLVNRKAYYPIDSAYLTITIPVSGSNTKIGESIKIEIFNNTQYQNNTQLASRRKE